MGGLVIDTVRPGVQFIPDAAAAFRRSNNQCLLEFGRDIDVNSTYRAYDVQMKMHLASVAYANGTGPYPGHSYAAHPDISRHTRGTALDSDDWVYPRILEILASNGFIRNQLHVAGEQHHFEWLREYDSNYGKEIDDMGTIDNTEQNYQTIASFLQRAFRYDVRPDGLGADWRNGPTVFEFLRAGATPNEFVLSTEQADAIATSLALQLKGAVVTEDKLKEILSTLSFKVK